MKPQRVTFYARTPLLSQAFHRAGERDRLGMMELQERYEREFKEGDKSGHQREGMAAGVHVVIDSAMKALSEQDPAGAARIACRKGCAHCCHIPIDITPDEARLLHMAADSAGVNIDPERLRLQALSPNRWDRLAQAWRRCVFLGDDDACMVYEYRPSACRKYQVLDNADNCDSVRRPGARVLNFVSIPAECVTSAAYGVFGSGPMAQQLLATWPEGKK